jgi:hypothetical protein
MSSYILRLVQKFENSAQPLKNLHQIDAFLNLKDAS